ncbi:FAD-dependent oxidoreductase [Actinoallomurus acanthiterrae]
MKDEVAVLGSGVIGLLTAKRLQDRGHKVRIYSASGPRSTTSAAAGSIILPFFPFDPKSVEFRRRMRWTSASLELYEGFARGAFYCTVDHVEFCRDGLLEGSFPIEWLPATNLPGVEVVDLPESFLGYGQYVRFKLPCVDSVAFLDHLLSDLVVRGVEYHQVTLDAIGARAVPAGFIFNCMGFGSTSVFPDPDVFPIFGQAIRLRPLGVEFGCGLGEFVALSTYYGLYLGSFFVPGEERCMPQAHYYQRLRGFATEILPEIVAATGLAPVMEFFREPVEVVAGVRPFRTSGVRLEIQRFADKIVVHNYGHGAHGWTLGWGSVIDAVDLWERTLNGEGEILSRPHDG